MILWLVWLWLVSLVRAMSSLAFSLLWVRVVVLVAEASLKPSLVCCVLLFLSVTPSSALVVHTFVVCGFWSLAATLYDSLTLTLVTLPLPVTCHLLVLLLLNNTTLS